MTESDNITYYKNNIEEYLKEEKNLNMFFDISIKKLIWLSISTFGIYQLYWFYQNWLIINKRENEKIPSIIKAILTPIYIFSFVDYLNKAAKLHDVKTISKIWSGLFWICCYFIGRLPFPLFLLSFFSVLPICLFQKRANTINKEVSNSHFLKSEICIVVIGFFITLTWMLIDISNFLMIIKQIPV
jgi:hypothetical protein